MHDDDMILKLILILVCTALLGCNKSNTVNGSPPAIKTTQELAQLNQQPVFVEGIAASYKGGTYGLLLRDGAIGIEGNIPLHLIGKTIRVGGILEITNSIATAEDVRAIRQLLTNAVTPQIALPEVGTNKFFILKAPMFQ